MGFFQPAIALMNRLNYPKKFLLISTLFILPLVLVAGLLFSEIHDRVAFAQKERVGITYLRALLSFSQSVQVNRRQAELGNSPNLAEMAAQFQTLTEVNRRYGTTLDVQTLFPELQDAWAQLDYPRLVEGVHRLRAHVGDCSNLILDPDLDSYYLMDATLLKLPEMRRVLFTLGAQLRQGNPDHEPPLTQLAVLQAKLEENLATAFRNNPKGNLKPVLQPQVGRFAQTLSSLSADSPDLEAQAFGALVESWQLWQSLTDELDGLLGDRIARFHQRQLMIAGFIGVILSVVGYLWVGFYRAVMETVGSLDLAATAMARGETVELTLVNKDELGQVVGAFNRIAKAVLAAEAKFRSIFENSVDGIFQTTPDGRYLSANPALAKMYGYESPAALGQGLTDIGTQLYVEGDRRAVFQKNLHESGQITDFESEVYRRDGSRLWIRENARAVTNDAGEILYYEGTVSDITERKIAEQALAQATAEIQSLNERLSEENLRMKGELVVARKLQQMILPRDSELLEIRDLEVAGFMQPADEVGGDYYDVLQEGGRVKIGIGDVTGHGLESGMVMLMVQMAVRTLLISQENDPIRFLNALNQAVYSNVQRMNTDKNLTLTLVDYEDGKMVFSGQHESILVVRANGEIECMDTVDLGFPIGLEERIEGFLDKLILYLQPNDVVVLYTDGVTEAENAQKELYGLPRLCTVLQQHHQRSAQEICQAIVENVRDHIQNHKIHDDITLLVLKQR
ncbi:MAG: SpoIIE family protein phosphatase [Oscillatoriales cyanobacterium SM2_1_8]|nr:SpoIIE family protein phosphatase [Oscillatoriales cyanobacterium SM2_1_8]